MSLDCASKLIASAAARAALLGIEVHQIRPGAWLFKHASRCRRGEIGVVHGLDELIACVDGFEIAWSLVYGARGDA